MGKGRAEDPVLLEEKARPAEGLAAPYRGKEGRPVLGAPKGAALVALAVNAALVSIKLSVGLAIGSVSVLSDALDSGMDLLSASLAFGALWFAARPADPGHPYGHGKMENISGVVESLLILLGAGLIAAEAARRLQDTPVVRSVELGIATMALSLAINIGASLFLQRAARRSGSIALRTSAWHRTSDILTSLSVLAGLIILQFSSWRVLDPVIAFVVAAIVVYTAVRLLTRSAKDLLDARLSASEELTIRSVLARFESEHVRFHDLKTRRSGGTRFVDIHLAIPHETAVGEAHSLTERIEQRIEQSLPGAVTTIHIEPEETHKPAQQKA
jgi:cation diffusion facilitator family transporter